MAAEVANDQGLWLGIDLGTTSVKAVLINIRGDVVLSNTCPTVAEVKSELGSSGSEQNPQKILSTVQDLVVPLIAQHVNSIRGIGVTGQMHGVLMWRWKLSGHSEVENFDQLDNVYCSNLYTWQDQRSTPEFLATLPRPTDSRQPMSTGYGCVTVFWLAQFQPTLFTDGLFTCCGTIMDFLVAILCGLDHPVTSDQLAASLGYFNRNNLSWDSVLYETKDFPSYLLPKIVAAGTSVGQCRASLKGWPSSVPVFVGMGDCQCAMYASLVESSDAAINISTSIQLGFAIPADAEDTVREESPPSIFFIPYFDGRLLALFAGLNGGNAVSQFVECIATWILELGFSEKIDVPSLLNQLQKLSEESPETTTSSLTVRPIFFGERHNTDLKGYICGICPANFRNIRAVFRSVCEGIVDHLHDMIPSKYLLNLGICRLLVSGSVPSNNPIVRQRLVQLYTVTSDLTVLFEEDGSGAAGSAVGAARFIKDSVKNLVN